MQDLIKIKEELSNYGQDHILQFWDELSDAERTELLTQLQEIDIPEAIACFKKILTEDQSKLDDRMQPVPAELYGSVLRTNREDLQKYEDEGFQQISAGKVGVLLLAGGHGTRLGVPYPKGMHDVGLPSHKSLYQIQAERIRRLQKLAFDKTGVYNHIIWYIMTSEATMQPTLDYFDKNNYFGLKRENVVMFEQGFLPSFTFQGKIIMDKKYKLSMSPDGNGGLYRALKDNKILEDMERRGIMYLNAHGVDNILIKVADPIFIGYCVLKGAECGAKVVEKAFPEEPVGVVCQVDGRYQVVEYSEITLKTAQQRNADGNLTFRAGNICNHFFTTQFLRKVAFDHESSLQLHVAKKKIPFVDSQGNSCKPEKPNGIKMEKFIFDVFQFTDKFVIWEVEREKEFSAIKNSDAAQKDTPTTARNDLLALHSSYIKNAGGRILHNVDEKPICEISPLLSYAGEALEEVVANKEFTSPCHLHSPDESNSGSVTVQENNYC